jgi:EmrB/QacA subfamily drug resistance transporter
MSSPQSLSLDPNASTAIARRWWILATVALGQLMVILDATVVAIALPSAQKDIGFSNDDRQWIITAYSLAFGSLLLFGGKLSDLIGRKQAFIIGLVGFATASAFGGAATSFGELAAARAIQGGFGALLAPTALAILSTTFTIPAERRRAFGIWGGIAGAGGALGLLLSGVLTQDLTWRWTFYVNIVFAVLAFIGALAFIRRGRRNEPRPRIDILGTALISAGLFGIVFGFSHANTDGWSSVSTWAYLAAGGVLILLFVLWQARSSNPLMPLTILKDRNRGAAFIVLLVAGAGILGFSFFLSYYLQLTLKLSPIETGLSFLPMILWLVISAAVGTTRIVPRFGQKIVTPIAMLIVAGGSIYLTQLSSASSYASGVLPALIAVGLGMGALVAPSLQAATFGVAPEDAGVASALVNTSQQVGGAIGTALLNTLAATAATSYLAAHQPPSPRIVEQAAFASYATVFWWVALFFIGGAVIEAFLIRRNPAVEGHPRSRAVGTIGQSA